MISSLAIGFVMSLSLIVAIGAQNAFVLRQGILREHIGPVVAVCAISDAVLITAGIGGLGSILTAHPQVAVIARYGGAVFLLTYAAMAARRALRPAGMAIAGRAPMTLGGVLLAALAFTFLNPHVYLDTVVLLGALANQHGVDGRWWYGAGAVAGSLVWFSSLGFGARILRPVFERPRSWQVLDILIAAVMLALGLILIIR